MFASVPDFMDREEMHTLVRHWAMLWCWGCSKRGVLWERELTI